MTTSRVLAPEFPDTLQWLNTPSPVKISGLRGKVVLLDFWTSQYIHCQHTKPDLHFLAQKYRNQLSIISIHSPKFPHERELMTVQKAINREGILNPVINDSSRELWKRYHIKSWPSIIFIDQEGYIIGILKGEGRRQQLDGLISKQLMRAEQKDLPEPLPVKVTLLSEPNTALKFPGRVLATEKCLYISDSGNNRILECSHKGNVLRIFGSKQAGHLDGLGDEASFRNPQGMVKVGDYLYVADAGNHAIRRIQMRMGEVDTVAGNGRQGKLTSQVVADPQIAQLNSPWDLAYHGGNMYIAMAGHHQIWCWQLSLNHLGQYAGTGQEGFKDGVPEHAMFAQPSGLCATKDSLIVADAESSSIRMLRANSGTVATVVGKGLFEYGDQDGPASSAMFQRPMAVCYDAHRKIVWICDTYNNKLKYMQMGSHDITTLDFVGLNEPSGVCVLGDKLWVANTNAHEILCLDLTNGTSEKINIRII